MKRPWPNYQKVLAEITKEAPDLKGNATAALAYAGIGDIYLRQEKFKEAEENFRRRSTSSPATRPCPTTLPRSCSPRTRSTKPKNTTCMAIQIKPDWPKPYLKLAYVSLNKGQMDKALEYLKKFCEIGKDDPKFAEGQALLDLLQKK